MNQRQHQPKIRTTLQDINCKRISEVPLVSRCGKTCYVLSCQIRFLWLQTLSTCNYKFSRYYGLRW